MAITALPVPPSSTDNSNYATRGDLFLAALPSFVTEVNSLEADVISKRNNISASAASAAVSELVSNAEVTKALNFSNEALDYGSGISDDINAAVWVSSTNYSVNDVVYSPLTTQLYRCIVTGVSTIDPSMDSTAWRLRLLDISTGHPTVFPALNLDFINSQTVDPRVTFTRASSATRVNQVGLIEVVDVNTPRIDYDPITFACKGLLIEEARVRLNTISALPVSPENITVTAVAHTISFYGTGSITLSGAYSAVINGAGSYPVRVSLTFTPSAGTLTITPSGSVVDLQVEAGSFASSVIRGEGSAITRAADVATISGTNFSSWYKQSEGTLVTGFTSVSAMSANKAVVSLNDTSSANYISIGTRNTSSSFGMQNRASSGSIASIGSFGASNTSINLAALAYKALQYSGAFNASIIATDTTISVPTVTRLKIGGIDSENVSQHVRFIRYYNTRLPDAQLQAITQQ